MPELLVLVHEVVAGKFDPANFARKKLDVDVLQNPRLDLILWAWSSIGILLWTCLEIHGKRIDVATLVLLVAVVRFEDVIAEEAFVRLSTSASLVIVVLVVRISRMVLSVDQGRVGNPVKSNWTVAGRYVPGWLLLSKKGFVCRHCLDQHTFTGFVFKVLLLIKDLDLDVVVHVNLDILFFLFFAL